MNIRMTDAIDGSLVWAGDIEDAIRNNAESTETVQKLLEIKHGASNVEMVGYQVMLRVERVPHLAPGTVLCACRLCERIFPDPHDGKCPHCLCNYIERADVTQALVLR